MAKAVLIQLRFRLVLAFKRLILEACELFLRGFRTESLSAAVKDLENDLRRAPDQSERLRRLLRDPITYLDIGARGGVSNLLARYSAFFKFFLAEGEPVEAERLRKTGAVVFDTLVAERPGRSPFYVTRKGGLSSILEPAGEFVGFYRGESDRFDVVKKLELDTTSVAALSHKYNVDFDAVKIDTQGTELDIIRGLGDLRPFFIVCEISFVELYKGQATVFELGAHLRELGYIVCDLTFAHHPAPGSLRKLAPDCVLGSGLPLHGDAIFIPNWNSEAGRAIIQRDERKWAALMLVFGLHDVLSHVLSKGQLREAGAIREALA